MSDSLQPGFDLEASMAGIRIVPRGPWNDQMSRALIANNVSEIELNYAKGWIGEDVEFLREFPALKGLMILDFNIKNIGAVNALSNLEFLEIRTYCKTSIDFTRFPALKSCFLQWRRGSESIFECSTLESLRVHGYPAKTTDQFSNLSNLQLLSIANGGTQSLGGLAHLNRLEELHLYNLSKLDDLNGLQTIKSLTKLDIKGCRKFCDVSNLASLGNLMWLGLSDCGRIKSIRPICGLPNLVQFYFYGTTVILDGAISCLLEMPKLEDCSFANRRAYDITRQVITALLSERIDV